MSNARAVVFAVILALAGCHRDAQQAPAGGQPKAPQKRAAARAAPAAVDPTADMVEAATTGKSTAPVEMKFSLGRPPAIGQAQNVALALMTRIPADSAAVQIGESQGLEIAEPDRQFAFQGLAPGTAYRHDLTVTPTADGVGILVLNVTLHHDELSETRTFSIPLIVNADRAGAGPAAPQK